MRVVVWNMSHWQKDVRQRAAAWAWLRAQGADVALLQEAVPPAGESNVVYSPIGGHRPWGSAVVGFGFPVVEITRAKGRYNSVPVELLRTFPGSVAVATTVVSERTVTFVSMYGVIDSGYANTTVNRQLSDLVPLFDDADLGHRIVLGGDLNITTQWIGREAHYRAWDQATLQRFSAHGLHDCIDLHREDGPLFGCDCADGEACRHVRTQWHPRSTRPWQNDYVFVSRGLLDEGAVVSARVLEDSATREMSDHLPLVLELAI